MTDSGFLSSDKIQLRGLKREDLPAYRSWIENPLATDLMETGWRPVSDAELNELYSSSAEKNDAVVFTIVPKTLNRPIGICGLYAIQWICRRADFRILIGDDDARGKGFGTDAAKLIVDYGFGKLNLETIYLGVNVENIKAVRSYEAAGFVHEGVRRKLIYRNGRYYDALMMSVLREEWAARRQGKSASR